MRRALQASVDLLVRYPFLLAKYTGEPSVAGFPVERKTEV